MKALFKLIGGAALGAAVGAGLYLVLSNENKQGIVQDVKGLVNEVIEEGKRAADARRVELEIELGQRPKDETAPVDLTNTTTM